MNELFPLEMRPDEIPKIPGLCYVPEYILPAEEIELVEAIDREPWDTTWQRRRQPYGAGYGNKKPGTPIPEWGRRFAARLLAEQRTQKPFDQMLVNEYLLGQGIAMHRDYQTFDRTVVSLSLLTHCVMDFRHIASRRQEMLLLEPRSLLILTDEARYDWEHGIASRKKDVWQGIPVMRARRLSITFRTKRQ
jgi:alkylated DNA repair dioxygenase AlkB